MNGKLVDYRDPRAIAAGGRTQWRIAHSPCVIEDAKQNKCSLRKPDGALLENCHIEDMLLLPEGSMDLESKKKALVFDEDDVELVRQDRKSLGELVDEPPDEGPPGLKKSRAKLVL